VISTTEIAMEFQPHLAIPIIAGALTVLGMIIGAACVFSVNPVNARVRR
jgi:hypothetical protein